MPNQQGGKNYKKSKHSTGDTVAKVQEAEADQLYGRVIKILGNLNMSVYCNDNYTRICKVCGAMRKRVWVNVGDLVIISLRDLNYDPHPTKLTETKDLRGDIIYKFDQNLIGKAKKLEGINPKLFMQLEGIDGRVLGELGKRANEEEPDQEGIIFDEEAPQEGDETKKDNEASEDDEDEVVPKSKKVIKKAKESKVAKTTAEDDDFDIDDI